MNSDLIKATYVVKNKIRSFIDLRVKIEKLLSTFEADF